MIVQLLLLKSCGCSDMDEMYKPKVVVFLGELIIIQSDHKYLKNAKKLQEQAHLAHLSIEWLRQVGKRPVFASILYVQTKNYGYIHLYVLGLDVVTHECVQHQFLGSVWA